ncbi:MAG: hypothetical protein LBR73_08150 [Oscillospiraceae bacterium]|jgi:hypothetical protein|nr:hypothetical protein [Oscillospiraceae bacterium]
MAAHLLAVTAALVCAFVNYLLLAKACKKILDGNILAAVGFPVALAPTVAGMLICAFFFRKELAWFGVTAGAGLFLIALIHAVLRHRKAQKEPPPPEKPKYNVWEEDDID